MDEDKDNFICYGGAKPGDLHLLAVVHCEDEEIIPWLERREKRRERQRKKHE